MRWKTSFSDITFNCGVRRSFTVTVLSSFMLLPISLVSLHSKRKQKVPLLPTITVMNIQSLISLRYKVTTTIIVIIIIVEMMMTSFTLFILRSWRLMFLRGFHLLRLSISSSFYILKAWKVSISWKFQKRMQILCVRSFMLLDYFELYSVKQWCEMYLSKLNHDYHNYIELLKLAEDTNSRQLLEFALYKN